MKQIKRVTWRDGYIVVEIDSELLAKTLGENPKHTEDKLEHFTEQDFFLMALAAFVLGAEIIYKDPVTAFVNGAIGTFLPANGDYGYKLLAVQGLRIDTHDMAISDYEWKEAA